jgi:ABC-type lipoprotein release transport system permease subunit
LAGVSHPRMAQGAVFTPQGLTARNGSAIRAVAFVDFAEAADVESASEVARAALS